MIKKSVFVLLFSFFCTRLLAQKTQLVWLDDLNPKTLSEGIPSISSKTNAGGDSIKMAGKYSVEALEYNLPVYSHFF